MLSPAQAILVLTAAISLVSSTPLPIVPVASLSEPSALETIPLTPFVPIMGPRKGLAMAHPTDTTTGTAKATTRPLFKALASVHPTVLPAPTRTNGRSAPTTTRHSDSRIEDLTHAQAGPTRHVEHYSSTHSRLLPTKLAGLALPSPSPAHGSTRPGTSTKAHSAPAHALPAPTALLPPSSDTRLPLQRRAAPKNTTGYLTLYSTTDEGNGVLAVLGVGTDNARLPIFSLRSAADTPALTLSAAPAGSVPPGWKGVAANATLATLSLQAMDLASASVVELCVAFTPSGVPGNMDGAPLVLEKCDDTTQAAKRSRTFVLDPKTAFLRPLWFDGMDDGMDVYPKAKANATQASAAAMAADAACLSSSAAPETPSRRAEQTGEFGAALTATPTGVAQADGGIPPEVVIPEMSRVAAAAEPAMTLVTLAPYQWRFVTLEQVRSDSAEDKMVSPS